jgi:glycosyltransferase 2 family protein
MTAMTEPEPEGTSTDAVSEAGRLKRWIKPVMNLLAALFVVLAARDVITRWGETKVTVSTGLAVVAFVPLLLSCLVQGIGWIGLVERMSSRRLPRMRAMSLYLASQLARYTPGKIGLPLVRMEGAPRLGLTRTLVGISILVESLSWTATGAVLGFLLLALTVPDAGLAAVLGKLALPGFGLSLLGLLVAMGVDRSRYPAKVRALLAPGGQGPIVPPAVPLIQFGYWSLVALHGYLMSRALGASFESGMTSTGFYVVASVAGFVVLAAPAGLGVREAVLLAGLTPSVGASGALGAALISRAASLVADILIWVVVRALSRSEPRPS